MKPSEKLRKAVQKANGGRCEMCKKKDKDVRWFPMPGVQMHPSCLDNFGTGY